MTMLHRQFANSTGDRNRERDRALRNVQTFNRANADGRTFIEILSDTPVLLAEFRRSIGTVDGFVNAMRGLAWLRLFGVSIVSVLYVLSPLDILPDFIPVIGQLDDMMAIVFLFTWIGISYRNMVLAN